MVIDFHTHIFPDAMAEKTISGLAHRSKMTPYTDGTLAGLQHSMEEAGVDYSVVLPVVTNPSHFKSVNRFAGEVNGRKGIISFGGIHPDSTDYKEELKEIQRMGLKGIKLHPDYQNVYFDDIRYVRIVEYAAELGLYSVVHAGVDIGYPNPVHCTPKHVENLMKEIGEEKLPLILAHTGGWKLWDEVEGLLAGRDIFFDISFSLGVIEDDQFMRIVKNHGPEKILFGTDSPWSGAKETIDYLKKLPLTEEEQQLILYKNACVLLGIEQPA